MNHLASKAKSIAALLGSVLTAVAGVITDNRWIALAAAVCTALAVYQVPNSSSNDEAGASTVEICCILSLVGIVLLLLGVRFGH